MNLLSYTKEFMLDLYPIILSNITKIKIEDVDNETVRTSDVVPLHMLHNLVSIYLYDMMIFSRSRIFDIVNYDVAFTEHLEEEDYSFCKGDTELFKYNFYIDISKQYFDNDIGIGIFVHTNTYSGQIKLHLSSKDNDDDIWDELYVRVFDSYDELIEYLTDDNIMIETLSSNNSLLVKDF